MGKCEFCGKDIEKGKACCWDYNWLYGAQNPGQEVSRDKMDLHYFCDPQCLVKWQKQEGIYDAAKKKSIERSGAAPKVGMAQNTKGLNKGFRYRRSKDHGTDGTDRAGA